MQKPPKVSLFASCLQVFRLTLRRQLLSRQTIVIAVLLGLALAITIIWVVSDSRIRSPMGGKFYRALSPESGAYFDVGDHVTADSVVCFVEGRRGRNEMKAKMSGVISEILVENDKRVRFRQLLIRIHADRTGLQLASKILSPLFMGFLLPIISLGYASATISGERTGQTLVYLLSTSIPRPLIYLSQYAAVLLLTLGITLGSLTSLCVTVGMDGFEVLWEFLPVVTLATVCYVGLFLLFSAWLRRATFLALGYALMIETLTANIPGVVKRITVSFYANSWLYDESSPLELEPNIPAYDPVNGGTAMLVLIAASLGFLALGMWVFSRKEYD